MENSTPDTAGEKAIQVLPAEEALSSTAASKDEEKTAEVEVQSEREATFRDFLRIFSYATKWDFVLMVAGCIFSIGGGMTMPLMNVVFGRLVGNFTSYFTPGAAPSQEEFKAMVNRQALYIFALFLSRFGASYINKFCFRMIGIRMSAAIRLDYLRSLLSQTVHVLDSMPSGQAASTITATANTLQLGISEKLGTFIEFNTTIITAIIIAFIYSWELTLVTSTVIVFIVIVLCILLPFIIKGHSNSTKAEAKASSIATEAFAGIRMVVSCGAESRIASRYSEWADKARHYAQRTSPLVALQFGLIFFSVFAMFALAFWYGTRAYAKGRLDGISDIIIVLMSVMMMVMSLERTSTPLIAASKAMVAAAEFFAVIDAPRPEVGRLEEPDVNAGSDIVFTDVTFAYPSRPSKKVLDGLNLRIEANKNTAIVGPSGSGKSTIVGLIEGWYTLHDQHIIAGTQKKKTKKQKKKKDKEEDTEEEEQGESLPSPEDVGPRVQLSGMVSTCGHKFDEINSKWWRSQIGLVQQEPFLFNDSIFKNVATGLIGTEWERAAEAEKRELVKKACVESFADEFIDRLPDGYDTQVGDSGTKLSGGQRQRIAIARSIVKRPKILILDEATSAIDVRGERIVQAALERASKGRTTITIAHRLSTIKDADKIVVLQNGKVAEEGTHEGLLSKGEGVYYGLVNAQKLSLGDEKGDEPMHEEEDITAILTREKSAAKSETDPEKQAPKWTDRNIFNGFGKLLGEQKSKFPLYVIAVAGACGAAAAVPLQAFLFAKVCYPTGSERIRATDTDCRLLQCSRRSAQSSFTTRSSGPRCGLFLPPSWA
jgi:ABC-type multidrug transport system fused ATPase/permease subunit